MQLSAITLNRQFRRFEKRVFERSNEPFKSIRDGLPGEWENYKEHLRKEALGRLAIREWKQEEIGTGRILRRVIHAIQINESNRDLRNNLVDWDSRYGADRNSHRSLLTARPNSRARRVLEQWFWTFFRGRMAESTAFESFRELAGNNYDLPAYLFFLKDWTRFMPIATATFDRAFALLGIALVTSRHCSWENYSQYNAALSAIQRGLHDVIGLPNVRLVDAHSFCWLLIQLGAVEGRAEPVISLPEELGDVEAGEITTSDKEVAELGVVDEEEFVRQAARRRRLGRVAQAIAMKSELKRLAKIGHPYPEKSVKDVSNQPGLGYDILSCELDGTTRHIEVKAARSSGQRLSFFLSANEWEKSQSLPNYHFYLVSGVESNRPRVQVVAGGKVQDNCLSSVNYLAALRFAANSEPE